MSLDESALLLSEWVELWKTVENIPVDTPADLHARTISFLASNKYNNYIVDEETELFDVLREKHNTYSGKDSKNVNNCVDVVLKLIVEKHTNDKNYNDSNSIDSKFISATKRFLQRLVDMDDPLNEKAVFDRRTISLNSIIKIAKELLSTYDVKKKRSK